jgi:transposase-like protein
LVGRDNDPNVRRSRYSEAYIEQFLREALRPGGPGPYALARERGLSNGVVYRWVAAARKLGTMPDQPRRPEDRSPLEKLRLVAEASRLNDSELGEFLRREGIQEDDLERWREEALGALGGARKAQQAPSKRIRQLERELARKDKALAEAAALLVLAKKARALLGDEDDDTSED